MAKSLVNVSLSHELLVHDNTVFNQETNDAFGDPKTKVLFQILVLLVCLSY
jgi:hypothetical protein